MHPARSPWVVTFSLLVVSGGAGADTPVQRQDLVAAQRQLEAVERLVERTSASATVVPGERYHFDYPRLLADLARVRVGIEHFLSPVRAQPREPNELSGHYRIEPKPAPRPEDKS